MLMALIYVLIICVVGAILFWVIEKFVSDGQLVILFKILVVLSCFVAILHWVLPLLGVSGLL